MTIEDQQKEIHNNQLDYGMYVKMLIDKLESGELTSDLLIRLLEQIYLIGETTGRIKQRYYQD